MLQGLSLNLKYMVSCLLMQKLDTNLQCSATVFMGARDRRLVRRHLAEAGRNLLCQRLCYAY